MKNYRFILLLIVFMMLIISCTKEDKKNVQINDKYTLEAQEVLRKLSEFDNYYQSYKTDRSFIDTVISQDVARAYLDIAINNHYSDLSLNMIDFEYDTIEFSDPVQEDGLYSMSSILYLYDYFSSYISSETETTNLFMVSFPCDNRDNEGKVRIIYQKGNDISNPIFPFDTLTIPRPFGLEDNWYWGLDLGKCDGSVTVGDAAQQLTAKFAQMFFSDYQLPDNNGDTLTMNPIWDVNYVNKKAKDYDNSNACSPYWLFYREGEDFDMYYCIEYDELNCYFWNIYRLVVKTTGELHYDERNSPIRYIDIRSNNRNMQELQEHRAKLTYYKTGSTY